MHLLSLYGSEAEDVARRGLELPDGLERIHPDAPDIWAQAHYAVEREWALTREDVARRTTLAVRGLDVPKSPGEPRESLRVDPVHGGLPPS